MELKYIFRRRRGDPFSDKQFANAIRAVSSDGQVRWGAEHLHYELARRMAERQPWSDGVVPYVLLLAAVVSVATQSLVPIAVAVVVAFVVAVAEGLRYLARRVSRYRPDAQLLLSDSQFAELLDRWNTGKHRPDPMMIVRAAPRDRSKRRKGTVRAAGAPSPLQRLEPDIGDYSFDRAVICDRARTVDVLIANNFHFEHNCAVLSVDGYPEAQFDTVLAMLHRNPSLRVFALHDCTPAGCVLAHRLATDAAWFGGRGLEIMDVGLRPGQAAALRKCFRPSSGPRVVAGPGISPDEARWLSRYAVELAVIPPEQLLKRLRAALYREWGSGGDGGGMATDSSARKASEESSQESCVTTDADSLACEAGDFDSGADGFG